MDASGEALSIMDCAGRFSVGVEGVAVVSDLTRKIAATMETMLPATTDRWVNVR
jgi:hypothetical protein